MSLDSNMEKWQALKLFSGLNTKRHVSWTFLKVSSFKSTTQTLVYCIKAKMKLLFSATRDSFTRLSEEHRLEHSISPVVCNQYEKHTFSFLTGG